MLLVQSDVAAQEGSDGRKIRLRALELTSWLLVQTRQAEAAEYALDRAMDDATEQSEAAAITNTRLWLMLSQGDLNGARETATKWTDSLSPRLGRASRAELATWGSLALRLAAAAVRDNRPGEAEDAMRLAKAAATAIGRDIHPGADVVRTFGPATVALKEAEAAAVAERPDLVLRLSPSPERAAGVTASNHNRHRLDVAFAHTLKGQRAKAVDVLQGIRSTAPEWLSEQRYARTIMERVVDSRRSLSLHMREMADFVGVPT